MTGALFGCSRPQPVVYNLPSKEEKAARAAFVGSHPELPPVLIDQLLRLQTTPEAALRRFEYVRARPGLRAGLQQLILAGEVRLHMKEHVRAAWGEPTRIGRRDGLEEWIYQAFSRRDPSRQVALLFHRGEVVDIRK